MFISPAKRGEVRRKELKKREEFAYVSLCTDDNFFGHIVAKCDDIKSYMEMETELIYVRIVE